MNEPIPPTPIALSIKLSNLIPIENQREFKLHLACWNGRKQPLDVFVSSREDWRGWNAWQGKKNDFGRRYVFSLIDFYPQRHLWLFGGIFEVINRTAKGYEVNLLPKGEEYIGRLKIEFARPQGWRGRAFNLEKTWEKFTVSALLQEPYSGEIFCGYERINHDFRTLETIFSNNKPDWKGALENVKGVYLITDTSNNRRYVGSAYGDSGIWSRWSCYIGTGHGWNDELTKLIRKHGIDYARKNFKFALLEFSSMKTDEKRIREREDYWKETLLTRGEFGYNKN